MLQIGIRAKFHSPWVNVLVMNACVSLTLAFRVLVVLRHVDHDCS